MTSSCWIDADFAAAVAFLHGEDDPEAHRTALRRGLTRLDHTARALRLDQREQVALQAELEPLGRTLPLDERARWNQEALGRAYLRVLEPDTTLRLALALSEGGDASQLRDMAELAEDARKVKAALEAPVAQPERVREWMHLALHNSKSLDWVTERAPSDLGGEEPTESGWDWLIDERAWGPDFKWVGPSPVWEVQGSWHLSTGPRTDRFRTGRIQRLAEREDAEPALLIVGGEPVVDRKDTVRIVRSAPTDRPGPMPAGEPEVWWLFGLVEVQTDSRIENNQRIVDRPCLGYRVRLGTDAVSIDQIVEDQRDGWDKDTWKATPLATGPGLPEDAVVDIRVKGTKVIVRSGKLKLVAELPVPPESFGGLWIDGTGFVELGLD